MSVSITTIRATAVAAALTVVALSTSAAQQTTRRTSKIRCTTTHTAMRDSTMRDSAMQANKVNCVRRNSLATTRSTTSTRSTTRIPVAKERTAGGTLDTAVVTPPATVDTTTVIITPTPVVVDTTPVVAPLPPAPVETTTVVAPTPMVVRHYGNGLYLGVGGGASMPYGGMNDAYKTGYNITAALGWDAPLGPLGIRADVSYDRFTARSAFPSAGAGTAIALTNVNPEVWSANADLKFRLPFVGRFVGGATTGLYAIGGLGTSYFRNYSSTFAVTNPNTSGNTITTVYGDTIAAGNMATSTNYNSIWRMDANVGGGLSLGFGNTELFVESRYIRAFTSPQRLSWVPIIVGLSFR